MKAIKQKSRKMTIKRAIEKGEKEIANKPLTRDVRMLVEELKKNLP